MFHGDKSLFGIAWELNSDPAGHFLLGKMCLWVGGTTIGDYELGTTLSDVLVNLTYPVGDCGNRDSQRFCNLSPQDAFSQLQTALFDPDPALREIALEEMWARFDISLPVDSMCDWRLYLIDCPSHSSVLVGRRHELSESIQFLFEHRLPREYFDTVIREFQVELETAWRQHAQCEAQ